MIRGLVLALIIATFAAPALAQEIDAATQARLEQVAKTGREINDHDQSAWHVTDALLALKPVTPKGARIGYITERIDPIHVKTIFLLTQNGEARQFFSGIVEGSKVISVENFITNPDAPKATPDQMRQLTAREGLGEAFKKQLCGKPINTVAIPAPDEPSAFDVYALASETETGVIQFGGHVKVRVGADGKPEGDLKRFSNSCIAVPYGAKANLPKDATEAFVMISLPPDLGDIPTEIHVFKSLSHGVPLMVMAGPKMWVIEGDEITLSKIKPPQ